MIASRRLLLACILFATIPAVGTAQARRAQGACAQITAACRDAGFVPGAAKSGNGLQVDCIQPILQGTAAPRRASKLLPKIDPQVIAACKAQNPQFGNATSNDAGTVQLAPAPAPVLVSHPAAPGSPNIVFILTDDLSMNLVQFMPHVLAMERSGVTFDHYFVTDSLCCPSRSSIFTGRYPHDTGVFKNVGDDGGYLVFKARGNEQATFAVALAAAGYRTAFMGKYLNGYEPAQHPAGPGWSHWMVAGNGYPEFRYALNDDGQLVRHGLQPQDYLTDVLAADAVRFIQQKADQPFFIEVATFAPHAPYTPAPRDANAFQGLHAPRTAAYNAAHDAAAPRWLVSTPALTQADMDSIDRDFRKRAQSVLAVDKMIGELQAAVSAAGQAQNTYFVFSSDNGYHMGEYRLMPGKMTAYDTDIHVPLVVTGPGVQSGRTVGAIVENVDLCPTFEELAGSAGQLPNVDGASLVPLLHKNAAAGWRAAALVEHHGPVRDLIDPDMPIARSGNPTTYEAIRSQAWLYVEYADGGREFHDLATDPDELHNTFSSISAGQKATLHKMLTDTTNCHSAKECWTAQGGTSASPGTGAQ
jgi:N-acetylglucosamine-6-sulfatase